MYFCFVYSPYWILYWLRFSVRLQYNKCIPERSCFKKDVKSIRLDLCDGQIEIFIDNFPLQWAVNFCNQIKTNFVIQINQLIWLTRIMNRSWIRHHCFSQERTVLRKALEVVWSSCALYILYGCFSVILELDRPCSHSLGKSHLLCSTQENKVLRVWNKIRTFSFLGWIILFIYNQERKK